MQARSTTKGALSQLETAKKNKKRSTKDSKGQSTPVMAIFFREWKTITRSPIYALNSLAGIFMALIIMILPMFGGSMTSDPEMKALPQLNYRGIYSNRTAGICRHDGALWRYESCCFNRTFT